MPDRRNRWRHRHPGPPPRRPGLRLPSGHSSGRRWLLVDYAHAWVGDILYVACETDIPCHLWLRWTDKEERVHLRPEEDRGLAKLATPYYCFVEWNQVEQNEPGDTSIHSFNFGSWGPCQRRWWHLWGHEEGIESPSTSCIFTAHYQDYEEANSLRHIDLTDKEVAGVIDHADFSVTPGKLVEPFTFNCFPYTPPSAPWLNYQVPNKKYVDDQVAAVPEMNSIHTLASLLTQYAYMEVPEVIGNTIHGHLLPLYRDLLLATRGNGNAGLAFINLNNTYPQNRAAAPGTLADGFLAGPYLGRYAYTYRGAVDPDIFYKYDLWTNTWSTIGNLPAGYTFAASTALLFDSTSNKVYAVACTKAAVNDQILEFDCATELWNALTAAPQSMSPYDGAALLGDHIYVARYGNVPNNQGLGRYTISTDAWAALTSYGDNGGNAQAALYLDKDNADYIYLTTGNPALPWQIDVWRYSITGNSWDNLGIIHPAFIHFKAIGYYSKPVPHLLALRRGTNIVHMFRL